MTFANDGGWNALKQRCAARGLVGDAMAEEVMRTISKPRTKGPLPPLPPVRETAPTPEEIAAMPPDSVSEAEFVEIAESGGPPRTWQIVRYDEPDLTLAPARIYLNGFTIVWDDAGMPADFSDGTPVTPDCDLVVLDGPNVSCGVVVCCKGRPEAVARVRHDQLLIKPRT